MQKPTLLEKNFALLLKNGLLIRMDNMRPFHRKEIDHIKKSLALILGLCIFLSACTAGNGPETIGDPTTTPPTSSQTTATTAPAETGGTNETLEPKETEPPVNPSHPATPLET